MLGPRPSSPRRLLLRHTHTHPPSPPGPPTPPGLRHSGRHPPGYKGPLGSSRTYPHRRDHVTTPPLLVRHRRFLYALYVIVRPLRRRRGRTHHLTGLDPTPFPASPALRVGRRRLIGDRRLQVHSVRGSAAALLLQFCDRAATLFLQHACSKSPIELIYFTPPPSPHFTPPRLIFTDHALERTRR